MSDRAAILHKVRQALGRSSGQAPAAPPPVDLRIPEIPVEQRIASFTRALEALGGTRVIVTESPRAVVEELLAGRAAVAVPSAFLRECGILDLPVEAPTREACATLPVGITSAEYALCDTGSIVHLMSPEESRLASLLPPVHIAVLPVSRLLTGLDELFTLVPDAMDRASAMIITTGSSRTGDIEQIIVRGVHGPGELMVVLVR